MERSTATRGRWGYVNMSRENHWYSFGLGQRWGPVLTDRVFFFIKCVLVLDQGFLSKQFWSMPEWRTPDYFPPMKNTQDEPPSRTALVKASAKKQPLDLPAPEGTLFLPKIRPLWVPENHRWHSCGTHYGQSFSIGSIKSTFWKIYPLVNVYSLRTWKWPSRNSWFTHCSNGGSFHSFLYV